MFSRFLKSVKPQRALPDYSTRELMDTKKRIGTELRASLYLYNEEKFIVCSIAGIAEYGEPIVLDSKASDESLGLALCNQLLGFRPRNVGDISKHKLDDWAAYNASGAHTGKYFEQQSMFVYVRTVNTAINIESAPRISNNQNLKALCSISNGSSHGEIGAAIREAIKASKVLRDAGLL